MAKAFSRKAAKIMELEESLLGESTDFEEVSAGEPRDYSPQGLTFLSLGASIDSPIEAAL